MSESKPDVVEPVAVGASTAVRLDAALAVAVVTAGGEHDSGEQSQGSDLCTMPLIIGPRMDSD